MPFTGIDHLDHSIDTSNRWLDDLAQEMGVTERREAYRALRGWLHTLRDRLTVQSGAHFAAQLPEIFRGVYYDGWSPSGVPVKYDRDQFLEAFCDSSAIRGQAAEPALTAVTRCLRRHMGRGAIDHAFEQLPKEVRSLIDSGTTPTETRAKTGAKTGGKTSTRSGGKAQDTPGSTPIGPDAENTAW